MLHPNPGIKLGFPTWQADFLPSEQTGKAVCQGYILSPCLFNFYAEYIMRNAGLDEAQAGIKTARKSINNLRYADDTTLLAESKELKSLLIRTCQQLDHRLSAT